MAKSYDTKSGQKVTTYYDDNKKNKEYVEKRETRREENKSKVPITQRIGRAAGKVGAWIEQRAETIAKEQREPREPREPRRRGRAPPAPSMGMMMGPSPGLSMDPFGVGHSGGFMNEPTRRSRKKEKFTTGIPDNMRWMF